MRIGTWAGALAALPASVLYVAAAAHAEPLPLGQIHVEGTRLVSVLSDGSTLTAEALIGAEVQVGGPHGGYVARIDQVIPDPTNPTGMMLYNVSVRDPASGEWETLCLADAQGVSAAVPVPGSWDESGRFVQDPAGDALFACTAGARGKCIRFGYPPWEKTPDGKSLAPYHEACVRMVRADHCGDGIARTVEGTMIQMFDSAGVHSHPDRPYGAFEAAWGPKGAVCIARSRRPEFPLAEILTTCPRLASVPPECCTGDAVGSLPGALIGNRS